MSITIRDASPADTEIIAAYNSCISEETEDGPLDRNLIIPGVEAVLADQTKGRYWLAEYDGRPVGQIMVTYEWSDWRNGNLWWIQSVYVHADFRRQGVFSKLYRHVESLARQAGNVAGIRLYVERGNERAQETYRRMGMTMTGYKVMQSLFS